MLAYDLRVSGAFPTMFVFLRWFFVVIKVVNLFALIPSDVYSEFLGTNLDRIYRFFEKLYVSNV